MTRPTAIDKVDVAIAAVELRHPHVRKCRHGCYRRWASILAWAEAVGGPQGPLVPDGRVT
jgi:hypothetical protein